MGTGSWIFIIFIILFVIGMMVVGQFASRYERKVEQLEKQKKQSRIFRTNGLIRGG